MKTHTTWQPEDDLQMRWHGGKTINIYQRTNSSFDWVRNRGLPMRPRERKARLTELAAISLLVFLLTVTACLFLFSAYVHLS
jgi:hypothetical protein